MNRHRIVLLLALLLGLATSEIRAQALKSSEFRINPKIPGSQGRPDVATAADGRFVVVWEEGTADPVKPLFVKARIFDAAGKPRSGEIQVARQVSTYLAQTSVAMAPDGRFVVVWGAGRENPNLVFGRRYAADGRPLGPRFPLSRKPDGQDSPDVAMAADGSFVAVWAQAVEQEDPDNLDELPVDVFFRRFGPDGRPLGPEVLAIGGYDDQGAPRVALRPDGSFVVVSHTYGGESSFYDIAARLFSRSGAPITEEFQVNDGPTVYVTQHEPAVSAAADGKFAIAWTDWNGDFGEDLSLQTPDDHMGVSIRFYAADGTPLGAERAVNVFRRGAQRAPAVSALQTGGFLMLWASGAGQDGDEYGIFGRVFGPDGTLRGREFRINLSKTGSQYGPALSVTPKGKGAAVWVGPDGDGTGIFARRIGKPGQGS